MTIATQDPADAHRFRLDPRVAKAFAHFAGGFWTGPSQARAWGLTLGLAAALTVSLGVTVGLNRWHRWFFDALERKDAETAAMAVLALAGIIASMAAVGVAIVITRETLQVRWREWIVRQLVGQWLARHHYYHLAVTHTEPPNPEYRIADDTRWATEPLVDLAIGLFSAVLGAAAFISILWTVGGSLPVRIGGTEVVIPAYMVIAALAYGGIASGLMVWVGRPLVPAVGRKNAAEGEFRFGLMRLRDNGESVALIGGSQHERRALDRIYDGVVTRWLEIVRQHGRITWITNASGPLIPIIPLLFAAPKYFSGDLTLGQVVQLGAAFVQVQLAISWVVDNFNRIAEWYASARRVMDLIEASDALDERMVGLAAGGIRTTDSGDGRVRLDDIAVRDVAGRVLIADAGLAVAPGEKVQVVGGSSTGKTVLVRVLAGLWPWGRGRVERPRGARVMVVPQIPYLPMGSLSDVLMADEAPAGDTQGRAAHALRAVGLDHLVGQLGVLENWHQILGNGDRQRLAVARVLLHRPDVVVVDDGLSALDAATQAGLIATIGRELPKAALLVFAQTARSGRTFDREFSLDASAAGAVLRPQEAVSAV
jgi:putative ATP-binding cassette transporter